MRTRMYTDAGARAHGSGCTQVRRCASAHVHMSPCSRAAHVRSRGCGLLFCCPFMTNALKFCGRLPCNGPHVPCYLAFSNAPNPLMFGFAKLLCLPSINPSTREPQFRGPYERILRKYRTGFSFWEMNPWDEISHNQNPVQEWSIQNHVKAAAAICGLDRPLRTFTYPGLVAQMSIGRNPAPVNIPVPRT